MTWRAAGANVGVTAVVTADARTGLRIVIGGRDTAGTNTETAAAHMLHRTARTTVLVTLTRRTRSHTGEVDTRTPRIPHSSRTDKMAAIVGAEVLRKVEDTTRTIAVDAAVEEATITLVAAPMAGIRTGSHMAMAGTMAAPTVATAVTVATTAGEAMVVAVVVEEVVAAAADHTAAEAPAGSSKMVDAAATARARTETPTTTIPVGATTDRVAVGADAGDHLAAYFPL